MGRGIRQDGDSSSDDSENNEIMPVVPARSAINKENSMMMIHTENQMQG